MTNEERVAKLEKQVRNFRLVTVGGILEGGFGELKPATTLEERISSVEQAARGFTLVGGDGVQAAGNFPDGYVIQ